MAISDYSPSASLNISISGINIGEGMARDDVNDAIRQIMADLARVIGTFNMGTLPSGSTNSLDVERMFIAAPDGTTQLYDDVHRIYAQGSNSFDYVREAYHGTHIDTTGGVTANAEGLHQYVWASGNAQIANGKGIAFHLRLDDTSDVTNEFDVFRVSPVSIAAGATANIVVGYSCGDIGGTNVTTGYAFSADDFTTAGVSIGFRSSINSGTNKYAFFSGGTAQSAFGGFVSIGSASAPVYPLHVRATWNNLAAQLDNSHASSPLGLRISYTACAPNNSANHFILCTDSGGTTKFAVASSGAITVNTNQVVGYRQTGWTAATNTKSRATFDTTTVTTAQLAQRVAALIDDLISHGLIGA